jgi:hypothetical protein
VRCILTAEDLPQPVPRFGPVYNDRPVIAVGETNYYGEPVAAVAAEDEDAAETAAALIQVEYQELPGVYSIEDALRLGAPLVQDPAMRGESPFRETNILSEMRFGWGDPDGVDAEQVFEGTYTFPIFHFIRRSLAWLPVKEGITVWSPIMPTCCSAVANTLNLPISKVRHRGSGRRFRRQGISKFELAASWR